MSEAALDHLNVHAARKRCLAPIIAMQTGLSYVVVRRRLVRAHGRTLLRNLFADVWAKSAPARQTPSREKHAGRPSNGRASPRSSGGAVGSYTVHRVRQEFSTSCGVAVVAMFARVSHREALSVLFPSPKRDYRTWLKDLKRALDHFGVAYAPHWHRFQSWQDIPTTSLVKVRWRHLDGTTGLHWVIFQRRANGAWTVIDPEPPRPGTLRLSNTELSHYVGISYLTVNARGPK